MSEPFRELSNFGYAIAQHTCSAGRGMNMPHVLRQQAAIQTVCGTLAQWLATSNLAYMPESDQTDVAAISGQHGSAMLAHVQQHTIASAAAY